MYIHDLYSSPTFSRCYLIFTLLVALYASLWLKGSSLKTELRNPSMAQSSRHVDGNGILPLSFIPNVGQIDSSAVRFSVKNQSHTIHFSHSEVIFNFLQAKTGNAMSNLIRLEFSGANKALKIEGLDKLSGTINMFHGNSSVYWHTGLSAYGKIIYRDLYSNIDLVYSSEGKLLKSEFIIAPQANPADIRLAYTGMKELRLRDDGALVLTTDYGELVESAPIVYQHVFGRTVEVEAAYELLPNQQVGFELGPYNPNYPLIIDPVIVYGSYLGGSSSERGNAIAIDNEKNIYVIGTTTSDDFPLVNAADDSYDGGLNGDVFVAKLDATGTKLIYATYLGGDDSDLGFGIAADAEGNAYVVGQTLSQNFPMSNPLFGECNGVSDFCSHDGFVAKLDLNGELLFSTYLGGESTDIATDIELDENNNVYLGGYTASTDFPTTPGSFQPNANFIFSGSSSDSFIVKMTPNDTGLDISYATYLGGSSSENIGANPTPLAIGVDSQGHAIITGLTVSDDFPTLNAAQPIYAGGETPSVGGDAFVAKLTPDGSGLVFATYLGGSDDENSAGCAGIAVDSEDNILVTGYTASADFPVQNAWQTTYGGGFSDGFVVKYTPTGEVQYATYLGGDNIEYSRGIATDSLGNVYVVGSTFSDNFPTLDPISGQCEGSICAFITKINSDGSELIYSSSLGGMNGNNTAFDVVVDEEQAAYVIGETNSSNFTTVSPVQPENNGGFDAFIIKLTLAESF